jgi:glycosyltransferase involved in cell wall biosynthesis
VKPLVSVVIPTFNCVRYVTQAVDSVLAQSLPPAEVIVVDDGSTDPTARALQPYLGRIRYVFQKNRGVYAARNRGISMAGGDCVAFLDADDLWHPDKLEAQVRMLEEHPEFGAVHTDASVIDAEGRLLRPAANPRRQSRDGFVFEEFFHSNMAVVLLSTAMIRKACFEKAGLFREAYRMAEDQFFFLRLAFHYPIGFIPRPLAKYRLTPGSLSRGDPERNILCREAALRDFLENHREYFDRRPGLARRKWKSFHQDAALLLFAHGKYALSHQRFRKALGPRARAWAGYLITAPPERFLLALRPRPRPGS